MRYIIVLCFFVNLSAPENPRDWREEICQAKIFVKEREKEILIDNILTVIRQLESSGNYHAKGGSGEYGAYQFTLSTWRYYSEMFFGENLIMTPENQDLLARRKVEMLLDQGLTPSQIASFWNSGRIEWEGIVGVNRFEVKYDTPLYVKRFVNQLKKMES